MRITPKSRNSWRTWLKKNHAERPEIWLVFYKRHTGKPTLSYNDAVEEAKRNGKWAEPAQKIDFSMPPELAARFERNKKAASFFETLAPSYQRQYIGWIITAKRQETRKRRLDEAIELLRRGEKLGMR